MLLLSLMLAAVAAAVPPPGPVPPFEASASDHPRWSLRIADGQLDFRLSESQPITMAAPAPKDENGKILYETPSLTVEIMPHACEDKVQGRRWSAAVFVFVGREMYGGCGGTLLPEESLTGTSWAIVQIGGADVRSPQLTIDFEGDAFLAYTACNRIGGTFVQAEGKLVLTPTESTRNRCVGAAGACEQRLARIIAEPMAARFSDRKTLLLSNEAGSLRLIDPDAEYDLFQTDLSACEAPGG